MEYPNCPKCGGVNTYPFEDAFICPDCSHEWNENAENEAAADDVLVVKDANGTILQNGDTVVTIKNLPVKGISQSIKAGTKVKNIRLTGGDHNIDCKIEGFGAMGLKSEFVKKVQ
jgi:protein PhnA